MSSLNILKYYHITLMVLMTNSREPVNKLSGCDFNRAKLIDFGYSVYVPEYAKDYDLPLRSINGYSGYIDILNYEAPLILMISSFQID